MENASTLFCGDLLCPYSLEFKQSLLYVDMFLSNVIFLLFFTYILFY